MYLFFLFLLFSLFPIPVYSDSNILPYDSYCHQQAIRENHLGNKSEEKNWLVRYQALRRQQEGFIADNDFNLVSQRLRELEKEMPVMWAPTALDDSVEQKNNSLHKDKNKKNDFTFLTPNKLASRWEKRKPSMTPEQLILRAEKAEAAGQFTSAQRYYRLALRLGSSNPGVTEKLKRLDELLKP